MPEERPTFLAALENSYAAPGNSDRLLQIAEVALACARMCAWDWDMRANETIFFGDPQTVFGCVPKADYREGFRSLVHPDDIERLERKIQGLSATQIPYEDEYRVVHPDGSIRWIYARGKFFHDAHGEPVHLIGVNIDVTEQRARDRELNEARSEVRTQHAMLDTIVNNIPVMICYMREPGRVDWANRAWRETLGWLPEENGGDTASLLYPDADQREKVREFIAKADGKACEFKTQTKAGETIETRWLNVSLPDHTNIGIGRDISAEKKSERELRESERRFQMLSDNLPQIVWITDPAGSVLYQNKRWYTYTGQKDGEGLGYGWLDVLHPDDHASNQPVWEKANKEGRNFENELRLRGREGEYRWFLIRGIPIRGEDGSIECWFGTNTDVTEKKQAQEALLQAERLAVAGRFAATIAHEVNNPLTSVVNIHYVLSMDESLTDSQRELLKTADNELSRVSQILRQTLAFYREDSKPESIKLKALAQEAFAIFGKRIESRQIETRVNIPDGLELKGCSGEVRQVLCNLIANAIEASGMGGHIVVRGRKNVDRSVTVTVADGGCGIAREHVERVFEPFFTLKKGIGTGLGLWVSQQLVERNHGRIRLRSRVGSGTVFRLRFSAE